MCTSIGPFSSGCKTETESRTEVHNLTERLSSTMQKAANSSSTEIKAKQVIDVIVDGAVCNCVIKTSQKMTGEIKVITQIDSNMQVAIRQQFTDELDSAVAKSSKKMQELLSTPDNSSSKTTVIADIKNITHDSLSLETLNSICNKFSLDQEQKFHIGSTVGVGYGADGSCPYLGKDFVPSACFDLDQNLQFNLMASSIISAVTAALKESESIQRFSQKVTEINESESKGLNDIAATAGKTVEGVAATAGKTVEGVAETAGDVAKSALSAWAMVIGGVLIAVCVFGFIAYKLLSGDNPISHAFGSALPDAMSSEKSSKNKSKGKGKGKGHTRARLELIRAPSALAITTHGASGYRQIAPPVGFTRH